MHTFSNAKALMMGKTGNRPTAIYKTKASIVLHLILYGAAIGVFTLPIIKTDVLWAKILCGVVIAYILWAAIRILRFWNDRIVIAPTHLSISHVAKKTRGGNWNVVGKTVIRWDDIRDISSQFDVRITNLIRIQKEVFIRLRGGTQYCIESDLYDVNLLEHKLKAYWHQYAKAKPAPKKQKVPAYSNGSATAGQP